MGKRRRMDAEDDAWESPMDQEEDLDGGSSSDANVFERRNPFDSGLKDSGGPNVITPEVEAIPEQPKEGKVKWKIVDGVPIPDNSGKVLRRVLVAVQGPGGILVAKAQRDSNTGKTRNLEPLRLPTAAELRSIKERGTLVTKPTVDPGAKIVNGQVVGEGLLSKPWVKLAVGVAAAGAVGFGIYKYVNRDGADDVDDDDDDDDTED